MLAIVLCCVAFVSCFLAGRRSLGLGLVVLFVFGYSYGIVRANLLTTFSHFIFDAGLLGLYLSSKWGASNPNEKKRSEQVLLWTFLLVLWPSLLVMLPFQPLLVSLVGLRGNIFFIPILLLASRLKARDLTQLSLGLALLNLVAVGFAVLEYFLGVQRFFPLSPVTQIMYNSNDVAGGFLRIPATFIIAHAFGGMMVATIPYLIGLWTTQKNGAIRLLGLIGIPLALMGVLMSATRMNFVFGLAMIVFVIFTTRLKRIQKGVVLVIMIVLAAVALGNARFQRFKSLDDASSVADRIAGSVNRGFLEILTEYPMGNGLGGGGTSIPYFLEGQVRNPIGMENEYARILAEQGIIGLLLWISFLIWFFQRGRIAFSSGPWAATRRLTWCLTAIGFATACIGTGLLTSIPQTALFILGAGWATAPPEAVPVASPAGRADWPVQGRRSAYPAVVQ
jgi:hypothetical protein